jgi:DNA-binding transcriptional MerR regulator
MSLTDTWGWLVVEGTLLASFLTILLFLRRTQKGISSKKGKALAGGRKLEGNLEKMNQLLKESESLSHDLSQTLAEKRELVKNLVESLDGKIQNLTRLLEKIEGKIPAAPPETGARDGKGQILEMATAGCGVADIAKRLGLSQEEVQLILDLRKITTPG